MIGSYVADMMIAPGKSPVFNNPQDFGLDYEDVTFKSSDGVKLSGWLIKGGTDKVIIQSHFGVQCSRAGYTPQGKGFAPLWKTDISFLNQARYLVDAGYSVLMYDFRNHGNSGAGTNPYVTWGIDEAKDAIAAVDFITNHPEYHNCTIGLLSICMGQSATTMAYGRDDGLQNYENIKVLISVQPLTYEKFVAALGFPKFVINRANKVIEQKTGIDFNENNFMPNVKDIKVPTLVIQNKNDPWTNRELVNEYCDRLNVEKELLWLDLGKQRAAGYDWIGKNPDKILEWFGKYM
ncbi:MAG: alpha/beta hydrolase [Cyanobacteria bacterium P01_F01_bin.143]